MQIAIDGPAGSGKSTISKIIARKLGILYLDTGAMYRGITWGVIDEKINFDDVDRVVAFAKKNPIRFIENKLILGDRDISDFIRTPEIGKWVSVLAAIPEIRKMLAKNQQAIANKQSVIMDGRDIGTVILPQADYKFYLDASLEARTNRRLLEFEKQNVKINYEDVFEDLRQRDENDKNRSVAPLVCAPDAKRIDTSKKNIDEVVSLILDCIKRGHEF